MADFKEIDTKELTQWIEQDKDFVLIDVLPADSYEARHLPEAVSIPFGEDGFLEEVAQVADEDDTVVVYCASEDCQLSPKAAQKLVAAGYKKVYDYTGGLAGWQEAGEEFESGE